MAIDDTLGAFRILCDMHQQTGGPLAGLKLAVKDLFDVAGLPTGAGSPEWLATHPVPTKSAWPVDRLLEAGAHLVGKTHTDELAWSLNGENAHYGTPRNPNAPGRIPGGSSSGSAVAVAGGLVDIALGSDTGGSVRLPASYCGIYGIRPTHGRVPLDGAVPLAPSYDTVGWFTREPMLLRTVGSVLLNGSGRTSAPKRWLLGEDLFAVAGAEVKAALADGLKRMRNVLGDPEVVTVAGPELSTWRNAFRVLQSKEAWSAHGEWVLREKPAFGPGVRERFAAAACLNPDDLSSAEAIRDYVRSRMDAILGSDAVLVLPTAPGIAPLLNTPDAELETFRARALGLLCLAGHAGLPQISLPLGRVEGCPVGLSLLGPRNSDERLIELSREIAPAPV